MSSPFDRIGALLDSAVLHEERLAGGDISGASRLELEDGRSVVAKSGPLVHVEADMLRAIRATGAPAPKVLASDGELVVIEYVEPAHGRDRWAILAETLHALHKPQEEIFGWDSDYAFGKVEIENTRSADWPQFWAERRLLCHVPFLDGALGARIERLAQKIAAILPSSPPSALLHGDLWGGNIIHSHQAAVLIDPACYYGHREVDLAMLTLFDHPPKNFFDSLEPDPRWRDRQPVYRLWPWLVHLRLFGSSYRPAVERELAALGF